MPSVSVQARTRGIPLTTMTGILVRGSTRIHIESRRHTAKHNKIGQCAICSTPYRSVCHGGKRHYRDRYRPDLATRKKTYGARLQLEIELSGIKPLSGAGSSSQIGDMPARDEIVPVCRRLRRRLGTHDRGGKGAAAEGCGRGVQLSRVTGSDRRSRRPEHEHMLEWNGGPFDYTAVDRPAIDRPKRGNSS